MVKKSTVDKTVSKPSSFNELNDALSKFSPDGAIVDDNIYARIDEWIGTGSYILNAAMSGSLFGGMPNRRSLMLAGQEGTGKTYLACSIVRTAQTMNYFPIYFDTEGSIDIEFLKRLGIDTSKIRLENIGTVEEFATMGAKINETFDDMRKVGKTPPKTMIILDSLGNLSSLKEKADTTSGDNKRDMTKQQAIRRTFRVLNNDFAKNGIPFVIANHVYACISGENKVLMESNEYKQIKDIQKGERVLTIRGPKEVIDKFDFDVKNYLELKFDDNTIIKCTREHKFMIERNDKTEWITADELEENDEILVL
jgi:preprotein translocase subunit YajC